MSEEIIDGELCNSCIEKTRCQEQQQAKKQRIDAILSYIANKNNDKYIAELKNEIPAITRCDVVLEKQLKRLQAENEAYKNSIIANHDRAIGKRLEEVLEENEELKAGLCKQCDFQKQYFSETKKLLAENERLKSEILMWQEQIEKRNEICNVWVETANNYKQAFEEIRELINETCWDYTDISIIPVKDKMLEIINEVLNER